MKKRLLVTGGAGFIGVHTCSHFAKQDWTVCVVDNLSRRGTKENLQWLSKKVKFELEALDIREYHSLAKTINRFQPTHVIHLAAQVAVTTSVANPREDFEINALGTLNVLEALRTYCPEAFLINASTNKVYGKMDDVEVCERNGRYEYSTHLQGISESYPLSFHSPYGCSKGTADQYTIDYARIFGLRACTFRQSCIYGTRQFGIEDQGWVAWFTIAAVLKKRITIYGDGKQVRDVLHVSDLIAGYEAAMERADSVTGHAFNVGGGQQNLMSLLELLAHLKNVLARDIAISHSNWRPGDQRVFVSDISKAQKLLGWSPKINVQAGVEELIHWAAANPELFVHL
jgi:CDP-paratose 2-epimerase